MVFRHFLILLTATILFIFMTWCFTILLAQFNPDIFDCYAPFPFDFSLTGLLIISKALMIYTLNTTPVLINLIKRIRNNKYLSSVFYLLPILLPLWFSFNSINALSDMGVCDLFIFHITYGLLFVPLCIILFLKRKKNSSAINQTEIIDNTE